MSSTPAFESDVPSSVGDIGQRLRNAAAFVPRDMPRLIEMGEVWAQDSAARLSGIAGGPVAVSFGGVDSSTGPAAAESESAHVALLSSRRFPVPGFVSLEQRFLELLIANLFHAAPQPATDLARMASDLDRSLMALALEVATAAGSAALSSIGDFDLATGELGTRQSVEEALDGGSTRYVQFRLELWAGAESAGITFALPDKVFAPHRRTLSEKSIQAPIKRDEAWSEAIKASFARSDMRLEAILAKKKVPLSTVAGFHVGQTIPLGIDAASFIAVSCEDRQLFRARMGRSRESYVMRIEERIDPAEEFIDDILSD